MTLMNFSVQLPKLANYLYSFKSRCDLAGFFPDFVVLLVKSGKVQGISVS